ncbi:MAG: hypothetical protein ABR907_01425 [Terracidiphilus sp.]|jgi:hypothetical protein
MPYLARAAFFVLAALPISAVAQHIAAASESTLTISGAGIPTETYHLAQVYGDWFATATDATAHLTMRTVSGTHQAQLGIAWDGKGLMQTITAAKNNDIGGKFFFSLNLTGAGAYGQSAQLRGSDLITVTITRMDSLTLEGSFVGTVTGSSPLKIAGAIKLHRDAPAEKPTGTFGNCDPRIYDKLAGAEWRSPSECEVNFDAYVRKELTVALAPVIAGLAAHGWSVTSKVEGQSLTSIPRHTETRPFQLTEQQMHQGGVFYVSLALDKNSPDYAQYDQPVQAAMQRFGAALKSMNAAQMAAAQAALQDASRAQEEHTTIGIRVGINEASVGISNFKGGHTVTPLSGGGFAVSAPYVQPATGGDVSGAQRVTYVFLGAFTPPAPSGPGTADENIQVKGALSLAPAKLLAVQNIHIRIQTGTNLAQQIVKLIDWNALRLLMAGK